jgi:hypothetical protein
MKGTGTVVALAGIHERVAPRALAWQSVAKNAYYLALAAGSVALLVLKQPHLDLSIPTLLGVLVVGAFLAIAERPQRATATTLAPMTSVLTVSIVVFGAWTLVLAAIAWGAIFIRREGRQPLQGLASSAFLGQLGSSTLVIYAMLTVWAGVQLGINAAPHMLAVPIALFGVLAVGLTWQSLNNASVAIACSIVGTHFKFGQLWRTGFIASLWAYFLIALYSFGGILAAALFYFVVAQTRMLDAVMGACEAMDKNERSQRQAHQLLAELMTLTDAPQVEFTREVSYLATQLGRHLDMPKKDIELLKLASELHEIGLCRVPAAVRSGIGLTPAQSQIRARHPFLGAQLLRQADALIPNEVVEAVELHREHFDGTGYPRGFKGNRIPVAARIIPLAADYIRLLTGYGGTTTMAKTQALEQIRSSAGSVYDPSLVDLLCRAAT